MARPEYYRSCCALCGRGFTARDLDKVYVRRGTYGRLVTMACLCQNCTARMADYLCIELPDLDAPCARRPLPSYCPNCMTRVSKYDCFCKNCGEKLEHNPWAGRRAE